MRYLAINGHRSKVPFSTWNFLEHHQNSFLGPSWDLYGAIKISGFQSSPKKLLNRHYIGRASKFRVSKQSLLLAQSTVAWSCGSRSEQKCPKGAISASCHKTHEFVHHADMKFYRVAESMTLYGIYSDQIPTSIFFVCLVLRHGCFLVQYACCQIETYVICR